LWLQARKLALRNWLVFIDGERKLILILLEITTGIREHEEDIDHSLKPGKRNRNRSLFRSRFGDPA
jgi:hypothetical protein